MHLQKHSLSFSSLYICVFLWLVLLDIPNNNHPALGFRKLAPKGIKGISNIQGFGLVEPCDFHDPKYLMYRIPFEHGLLSVRQPAAHRSPIIGMKRKMWGQWSRRLNLVPLLATAAQGWIRVRPKIGSAWPRAKSGDEPPFLPSRWKFVPRTPRLEGD